MSLSKNDEKLYRILELLKLQVNKVGELDKENLSSLTITAMREVAKLKITGELKKETVGNVMLLLIREYACSKEIVELSAKEIDHLIQNLYDTKVIVKKKCCAII
jgi:hypothetical protein